VPLEKVGTQQQGPKESKGNPKCQYFKWLRFNDCCVLFLGKFMPFDHLRNTAEYSEENKKSV